MFRLTFNTAILASLLCFSIQATAHHGGAAYDGSLSKNGYRKGIKVSFY